MSTTTAPSLTPPRLLSAVTAFYAESRDANGLPVSNILMDGAVSAKRLDGMVAKLVSEGKIEVVWAETDDNPHIRRLPRRMRKPFADLAQTCSLENACFYPSEQTIAARIDLSKWDSFPYTRKLWGGGSQLDLVFFDIAVLERYRNDPRYRYSQSYFGGSLHVKDDHYQSSSFPERDKVFIEQFGIGYDAADARVICVILSDLRDLTAEHQNAWVSYERHDACRLNSGSFDSWFSGVFTEYGSLLDALPEELRIINEMTHAAFGRKLFKEEFSDPPKGYGVLLRPTYREFLDFSRALDLMLSENIDKDFFPADMPRSVTRKRADGTEYEEQRGTVQLLEDWIRSNIKTPGSDPAKEIGDGLRAVRKLRSKASHGDVDDSFNQKFEEEQRVLLRQSYVAVRTIRLLFANHPATKTVTVPGWLFTGEIRMP